jgi:hypothetical protein
MKASTLSIFDVSMKSLVALLCLILPLTLCAQHGNEWISFGQVYAKIRVGKDGIYQINDSLLQVAGFPRNIDPRNLQIYHRGIEQPIIVSGESDGVFNTSDYVVFYGKKNDGTLDQHLYEDPTFQPHKLYNLFNDTTSYFLTVGGSNGKRMNRVQYANSGYPAYTYHFAEELKVLTESYSEGRDYGEILKSTFDAGEGFMGARILQNNSVTYTLSNIKRTVSAGVNPTLELQVTGRGPMTHIAEIYVGASSRLLTSRTVSGFSSVTISETIEWTDIDTNGDLPVKMVVKVSSTDAARISVNYLKINYPQELAMAGSSSYQFKVPVNGASKSVLEFTGGSAGTRLFDVTDRTTAFEIGTTYSGNVTAVVPSENSERALFATNQFIKPAMEIVSFRFIDPQEHNYIIISHDILRKPSAMFTDPVKAYAAYRASIAGGEYDTLVVNIDDVYNQFSYGEQTPLAIFNFLEYLADVRLPDYLFLIGKGLDVHYNYFRNPGNYPYYKNLVPSAGMPASDAAYSAGLDGSSYKATISTGRLSAMKPAQVEAYLKKVIEKESTGFQDLRKKNLLHLSGGIYSGEPQAFRSYLKVFADIAEGYYLGGKVDAIAKQSTDIKLLNISDQVNSGLNLITFFGHSSPGTIDFDIGYVTDEILGYHNKGKYPMLLMNGCQTGAFQLNGANPDRAPVFGEDWINATDKGAVGFIAHSSYGFIHLLRKYSGYFYNVAFGDSVYLTKGVGDVQREVAKRYLAATPTPGAGDITQVQQMMLLGDPAVSLFGAPFPDYDISDDNISLVSLEDNPITAFSDSFAINFIVRNYGQARNKPLHVQIKRTYGNRLTTTYDSTYSPLLYSDTLSFIIKGSNKDFYGDNTFEIRIDANDDIVELNESNNIGYIDYFVPKNGTQNLFPRKFGIISQRDVNLSFQHSDVLSEEREFLMEIDTINTFDSPFKQGYTITATVLGRKAVTLLQQDSLVYYWRTKLAAPEEFESVDWTTSSFAYINQGPDGWTQRHFPQLMENTLSGLTGDPAIRLVEFNQTITNFEIRNFGMNAGKPSDSMSFKINGEEFHLRQQGFGCRNNTINLVAFDKVSTAPYIGIVFNWATRAGRTCGREPWVINSFTSNELITGNHDDLSQYVDNISSGDSVVLFTIGNASFSTWPAAAKAKLQELGISISQIESLIDGEPVVIIGRKNSTVGTAKIIKSNDADPLGATLQTPATITGRSGAGKIVSPLIGPATAWADVKIQMKDTEAEDVVTVNVIGVKLNGEANLLLEDIGLDESIAAIDATIYPQIRLSLNVTDTVNVSSPQLASWMVTFEPVAEGLIIYQGQRTAESLLEGAVWSGQFGFINVSDQTFNQDLSVVYKVFNHDSQLTTTDNIVIQAPAPGDTTLFTVPVNTFEREGLNDISVDVNPNIQPEQTFDNNQFSLPRHLFVIDEVFDPVLDVTIDGRHIENDEYVSGNPVIQIDIWDESPYLLKVDTTGVNVFLAFPCGEDEACLYKRVNFSDENVSWEPATETSGFKMVFKPDLEAGRYVLLVEATDQSGNPAGSEPFQQAFRVRSENLVEISSPYPNPTTSSCKFALTLAGDVLPDQAVLTITSVSGLTISTIHISDFHHGKNVIDLDLKASGFNAGIYIYDLTVFTGSSSVRKRGKLFLQK